MGKAFAKRLAAALWIACASWNTALAQGAPLGQMHCEAEFSGIRIAGQVYASLWNSPNFGNSGPAGYRQIYYYLMTGQGHLVPGTVQLFGDLRNSQQQIINFEVFLTGGTQGTGAFWINGASHRSTYMQLVMRNGGFVIRSEDGVTAEYRCK
ncbi:hypothetical protein NBRC116601_01740 [Cognatishimia sp. WU-CL00825]|uniref:hypothetical protein n=1 Tax=Cognatishimia sp. WU-CL00825 TaxID=3127658 RepID=UPI0031046F79